MKKITVFGGDGRLRIVRDGLISRGFAVDTLGLYDGDTADPDSSDLLLLPVPATRDGVTVHCPLTGRKILLSDLASSAGNRPVLAGNYTLAGTRCTDYCKSDAYALRNAVPTAEGAIRIAMDRTPYTLWNSRVLVIGCGRVGRVLCDRLLGLRCLVTVSARKSADFAWCEALGMRTLFTADVPNHAAEFDIIFNTVDLPVLDPALETLKDTVLIDLSTRGGFDLGRAEALGLNCCRAPGLPGREAPETAGKILLDTVLELIAQTTP